ncbi:MAG: hypothetical protein ACPIOQ_49975, partial [Promethearchaeia archaeon]
MAFLPASIVAMARRSVPAWCSVLPSSTACSHVPPNVVPGSGAGCVCMERLRDWLSFINISQHLPGKGAMPTEAAGAGLSTRRLDLDMFANTAAHAARLAERGRAFAPHCSVMRLQAAQHSGTAAA